MKKIFLVFILAGLTAGASAQTADTAQTKKIKTPEERATSVSKRMVKQLGINEDQKTKVYAAILKEVHTVKAAKEKQPADKAAVKAAREAYEAGLKTIFTPEQFTKWDAFRKAQKAQRKPAAADKN